MGAVFYSDNSLFGFFLYGVFTLGPLIFCIVVGRCYFYCRTRYEHSFGNNSQEIDDNTEDPDTWFNGNNVARNVTLDQKQRNSANLLTLPKSVYRLQLDIDDDPNITIQLIDNLKGCYTVDNTNLEIEDNLKVDGNQQDDMNKTKNDTIVLCYKNLDDEKQKYESCCVCLEIFNNLEIITVLPNCKHYFHPKCIGLWIVEECKNECPLCKQIIFDNGDV